MLGLYLQRYIRIRTYQQVSYPEVRTFISPAQYQQAFQDVNTVAMQCVKLGEVGSVPKSRYEMDSVSIVTP